MPNESSERTLDEILLEQLWRARRSQKTLRRYEQLLGPDPVVITGRTIVAIKVVSLENLIEDKSLLTKKYRRASDTNLQVFGHNVVYDFYRNLAITAYYGPQLWYRVMLRYLLKGKRNDD